MVKINKNNDTEQLCKGNISQEKNLLIKSIVRIKQSKYAIKTIKPWT